MKKFLAMLLAVVLIIGVSVSGTLAWLTSTTQEVTNTFTAGDVAIDLWETKVVDGETVKVQARDDYKLIPGTALDKDPTVQVRDGSENCWLFVKVSEVNWPEWGHNKDSKGNEMLAYSIDSAWTSLDGVSGVYYIAATGAYENGVPAGAKLNVLTGKTVTVSDEVTKAMMNQISNEAGQKPQLNFVAYAVQFDNVNSAADAWAAIPANEK